MAQNIAKHIGVVWNPGHSLTETIEEIQLSEKNWKCEGTFPSRRGLWSGGTSRLASFLTFFLKVVVFNIPSLHLFLTQNF